MEIYYAWSQLESYVDISLLLGQLAYRLPHPTLPPPHTLSYHVFNFLTPLN